MQAGNGGNLGPALFDGTVPGIISFGVWETGDCGDPANIGVTYSYSSGSIPLAIGTHTVTVTAVDGTGNGSECTFEVPR